MFLSIQMSSWEETWKLGSRMLGWGFRGHHESSWILQPSLERALAKHIKDDMMSNREKWVLREFSRRAHHYLSHLPPEDKTLEWLALMQHHGAPTRLLDITHSFPVAAFFAVEKAQSDAAIWAFNLTKLEYIIGKRTGFESLGETIDETYKRHLLLVEDFLAGKASGRLVIPVEPDKLNERLSIQQGLFLMPCDLNSTFEKNLSDTYGLDVSTFRSTKPIDYKSNSLSNEKLLGISILKIILPKNIHVSARDDMWKMNVSAATLFPGLDGFARSLNYHVSFLS